MFVGSQDSEISAEMMTFHEAVSQLQQLEDDVLESHKAVIDSHSSWRQRHTQLLGMTKDVDYDQDGRPRAHWAKNVATFTFLPLLYTVVFLWVFSRSNSGSGEL